LENSEAKQNQKIKKILTDLSSGDGGKISNALKYLQVNGDISVIRPLVSLLKTNLSPQIEGEILEFLGDLKVTSAAKEIISILKDGEFYAQRCQLLSTVWNCKVDYSEYLADFVEIACDGDFMEALECITILENMEGPFEERHILESQLHLKEYLQDSAPKDPQKLTIMGEIAMLIRDFDLNTDD
jgi:hypothetical protein